MITRLLILLLAGYALGPRALAQTYADAYPRNSGIDVIGYVFDIEVTDADDVIRGQTAIDVRFIKPATSLRLDLVGLSEAHEGKGMKVIGVQSDGESLAFTHADDVLVIDLGQATGVGEQRTVHVRYEGVPAAGLVIGPNKYGDRTFFSDNWSSKARNWLPVVDHPSDKATTEMRVVAPSHYQVASNGILVEHSDIDRDRRLTHWMNPVPTASWLYFLGVARMAVQVVDTWEGIPLETWVYWQDRDAGFYDFAEPSMKVLAFYSHLVGPYVNRRLANIVSNATPGGGMEAASTPAYSDRSVSGNREARWQHVIIHEIAHQWFGNAVTELTWNDVWLSEGFATYYTLLAREYLFGHDDFQAGLLDARRQVLAYYAEDYDFQLVRSYIANLNDVSGRMMYQKGAWVLHMLREQLGAQVFDAAIRAYYAEFMNRNVQTADLRRHLEEVSGQDLKPFFQQWLFQGGVPTVAVTWQTTNGTLHYSLQQTQPTYRFDLEVELQVHYADGTRSDVISVPLPWGETVTGSMPVGDRVVVEVTPDPHAQLLAAFEVRYEDD
ncbi:MAG TPA: M1 family metallopeptidase [Rhodothermales bacterium]|nr:M1 family metallopeptidase [Rhodothermales bacterium]